MLNRGPGALPPVVPAGLRLVPKTPLHEVAGGLPGGVLSG